MKARSDLLNKTCLRVLKRYLHHIVYKFSGLKAMSKTEKKNMFMDEVLTVIKGHLQEELSMCLSQEVSAELFTQFVAYSACAKMSKRHQSGEASKMIKVYHDTIYAYSHKKNHKAWRLPIVKTLFTHLMDSGKLQGYLSEESMATERKDLYFKGIKTNLATL
jgi:hypothetical protein